jgi:hypothetical protein
MILIQIFIIFPVSLKDAKINYGNDKKAKDDF